MGKEIKMGGSPKQDQNITINAADLIDIICTVFRQASMFKRLSALISPSGKEQIVPIPVFRCDDCGNINDEFLPKSEKK